MHPYHRMLHYDSLKQLQLLTPQHADFMFRSCMLKYYEFMIGLYLTVLGHYVYKRFLETLYFLYQRGEFCFIKHFHLK